MERHGAVLLQNSSPGKRASPQTIVPSKVAYTIIYDELGAMENAKSHTLVVRNEITGPFSPLRAKQTRKLKFCCFGTWYRWDPSKQKHLQPLSLVKRHPLKWPAVPRCRSMEAVTRAF